MLSILNCPRSNELCIFSRLSVTSNIYWRNNVIKSDRLHFVKSCPTSTVKDRWYEWFQPRCRLSELWHSLLDICRELVHLMFITRPPNGICIVFGSKFGFETFQWHLQFLFVFYPTTSIIVCLVLYCAWENLLCIFRVWFSSKHKTVDIGSVRKNTSIMFVDGLMWS